MSFDFGQDLRHALRRLRAQPATATLAVALLALAIGMSSTMFTVVDALILRPAPFRDASSFVQLGMGASATRFNVNLPLGLIRAFRAAPGLAAVHGVIQEPATFGTGESTQTQSGARITPGLIDDLGVNPLLGRTFVGGEGRAGTDDVGIISASPADLRVLVHSSSLAIGAAGIGAGAGLAWALGRLLAAVQYQVRLADPLTWGVVMISIALTTVLAAWRPGRQAMRADPLTLLREE